MLSRQKTRQKNKKTKKTDKKTKKQLEVFSWHDHVRQSQCFILKLNRILLCFFE